jgi:hypothetical protein
MINPRDEKFMAFTRRMAINHFKIKKVVYSTDDDYSYVELTRKDL